MNRLLGRAAYWAATVVLGEGNAFKYLREARSVHQLPAEDLSARQREKLGELLGWLRNRNGYYGPMLAESGEPEDPAAVLRTLPLLEKGALQRHAEDLVTADYRTRTIQKSTGGSTGAPVRIIKDADGVAREMATTWAALESYGIGVGERSARFWGTPLTRARRLRFRLTDLAMNRIRLSAFDLDDEDLESYWRRCLRFQPTWMYGYASLIHMFAAWIEQNGLDGTAIGLRSVVTTSEPITDQQRKQVSAVFGVPVYDEYGCGEVGAIGYGCEEGQLHVMTENVVVEILDEGGRQVEPGEVGEVVVTDLTNYAMPLVRYRLGDRATLGSGCDCGRGFPTIGKVLGRIHDVVFTPAGRRWHGEKLDYLMSQLYAEIGGFRQYQVVQETADTLRVCLVSDSEVSPKLKRRIIEYVAQRLDGMHARVERVDAIERAPSGKIRLVRNDWLGG